MPSNPTQYGREWRTAHPGYSKSYLKAYNSAPLRKEVQAALDADPSYREAKLAYMADARARFNAAHPGYDADWRAAHPNYWRERNTNWRAANPNYWRDRAAAIKAGAWKPRSRSVT